VKRHRRKIIAGNNDTAAITPCLGFSLIAGISATGDIFSPISLTTAMKLLQQYLLA
jgi:hypothetical protein